MKTLFLYLIFTLHMIKPLMSISQVSNQATNTNTPTGVNNFNVGLSLGNKTNLTFSPGIVNNPSGSPSPDNERTVFWVHGLNGDIGSWVRAATASQHNVAPGFRARKLKSQTTFTYTQSASLLDAGHQLGEHIEAERSKQLALGEDPTKNFIIAHSQGGMVSRGLMHLDLCIDNKDREQLGYGGLVTFCSPHQGAHLLNEKAKFVVLSQEMCDAMLSGPTTEFVNDYKIKFKVFGFIPITIRGSNFVQYAEEAVDKVCESFSENVVPFVLNSETPNITKDYQKGAPLLSQMNACVQDNSELAKVPKIAFYGVEPKDHLMLRTVKYFLESSQAYNYFEANDDMTLIKLYQQNFNKYQAKVQEYQAHVDFRELYYKNCLGQNNTLWCKFNQHKLKKNDRLIRDNYQKGVDFLNGMDDKYKLIIGALEIKKTSKYYCVCTDAITGKKTKTEIQHVSECPQGKRNWTICGIQEEVNVERIEKDSDGVVLAESASDLPGATFSPQLMQNTSHMQARNNNELQRALIKLYDGRTDQFFTTAVK